MRCYTLLSAFSTRVGQNKPLYTRYQAIKNDHTFFDALEHLPASVLLNLLFKALSYLEWHWMLTSKAIMLRFKVNSLPYP